MLNNIRMVQWVEKYPVLVSLVATVVVVVLTIWVTRRYGGNRRIRLRVAWDSVRMVAASRKRNLEIRLDGKVVRDPFLVTVAMHNAGPSDISEANFNRSMPMKVIVTGVKIVDVIDPADDQLPYVLSEDRHELLIGPGLLQAKARRDLTLITEGEPARVAWGDLVNVDTKRVAMEVLGESGLSHWLRGQGQEWVLPAAIISLAAAGISAYISELAR